MDRQPTALYRLYDAAEVLLYVGIGQHPDVRFGQHARDKPWWPQVARREIEWLDDRASAERAEAVAIRAENPEHNGTHSPRRRYSEHDQSSADGVREVSLTIARRLLTTLIEQAREKQLVSAFTVRKRRRAYLVSADFYDRALAALGEPPAPTKGQQPA
jgi:hypothetical protein